MRKRFRVLILAAIVVAVVVPFGLALSLEPSAVVPSTPAGVTNQPVQSTVVALTTGAPSVARRTLLPFFAGLPDGAKLFLMGALLLGLAAAVKKAVYSHSRSLLPAPRAYNRDIPAR